MKVSPLHPRYKSLKIRSKLEHGVKTGITSLNGLIAHGRGEALDYLLGEQTHEFAHKAIARAAVLLKQAKKPVISVNGNTAALVVQELVTLSQLINAPLEINLFHTSKVRVRNIQKYLYAFGAKKVLLPQSNTQLPYISSDRKYCNRYGIFCADVVFVPLEDGDRAEALSKNKKKVITIDLNPLSRTARAADVTIVDNIVRALPLLIQALSQSSQSSHYSNSKVLQQAVQTLRSGRW